MKFLNFLKKVLQKILWKIEKMLKSELYMSNSRTKVDQKPEKELSAAYNNFIKNLTLNPKVKNGLFKGLVYPSDKSFGSSLYPKLIGSYELELEEDLNNLIKISYKNIFIIGCAEGYYCNGLAMQIPRARVYCFDILQNAINFCNVMSEINNVSETVFSINEKFDSDKYSPNKNEKNLILCDIEGAEFDLFNKENILKYTNTDLIIECHDFYHVGLTEHLKNLFKTTHQVSHVFSVDDLYRPMVYKNKNLVPDELDYNEKYRLFKEYRKAQMSWLILVSN